jgi:hypothetical protein
VAAAEVEKIIAGVQENLDTAKLGLRLLGTKSASLGIRNVIVFGRTVTFALQKLRGKVADFDQWYEKQLAKLSHPNFQVLNKARSEIEKQGRLDISGRHMQLHYFDGQMQSKIPEPPRAKAFFIGDKFGGSGWEVTTADGQEEKFYVDLPESVVSVWTTLNDKTIQSSLIGVLQEYLAILDVIVADARTTFLTDSE